MKIDWIRFFDDLIIKVLKGLFWISQVIFLGTYNWFTCIYLVELTEKTKTFYPGIIYLISSGIFFIIALLHTIGAGMYLVNIKIIGDINSYDVKYPLLSYIKEIKKPIIEVKNNITIRVYKLLKEYKK